MKGEHQAYIGSNLTGPGFAGARCAASTPRRRARPATTPASTIPTFDKLLDEAGQDGDTAKRNDLLQEGQQPALRRSAGLVLQLQQGGAGLSAVGPRPAGQPDRDHAPVSRGHLGRRQVAREVTRHEAHGPRRRQRTSGACRDASCCSFVVRRLANIVPTVLAVIALIFLLFSVLPGSFISGMNEDGRSTIDPAVMERMRKEMGLDDPAARALRQVRRQYRHGRSRHLVPHARAGDQAARRPHLAVAEAGLRRHDLRHRWSA